MYISIVEDDEILAKNIWKKLSRNWYETTIANNIEDFKNNTYKCNMFLSKTAN